MPYNSCKFENDLKFFREWFRVREEREKARFDFFYGQYESKQSKVIPKIENSFKSKKKSAPGVKHDMMMEPPTPTLERGGLKEKSRSEVFDHAYLTPDDYKKDLKQYFMHFETEEERDKKLAL